tara:strand:- start:211 stop:732 length:522 start_codon:yes stop_codon:yes gene_type:complete
MKVAARQLGVTPKKLAEVVALTSPRVPVARNMRMAVSYLRREELRGLDSRGLASELRCLPGVAAALLHWEESGEIRGRKTAPFARAILGDGSALVLDTHMAKVLKVPQSKLFNVANHAKIAKRFDKVSRELGWSVAEVQAAVWTTATETLVNASGRRTYAAAPQLGALILSAL